MTTARGAACRPTIAAISTPPGEGGIGIVRITGDEALAVAARICTVAGKPLPADTPGPSVRLGSVYHPATGALLDEVLVVVLRAPRSYTGEDTVELQGHGGPVVLNGILDAALVAGASPAKPGDFTRRAVLTGRLDLARAESVAALVGARTGAARDAALAGLCGMLTAELTSLKEELLGAVAEVEAALDLDEEDLPEGDPGRLEDLLTAPRERLSCLLERTRVGALLADGVTAVIAGSPNVGKSSLLNALLGTPRAIVTPHPGTTRDTVEGWLDLDGVPLRLVDCAGIREVACEIEREGVRRSLDEVAAAPVVLLVLDASRGISPADESVARMTGGKQGLVVLNKADLPPAVTLEAAASLRPGFPVRPVSSLDGRGLDDLRAALLLTITGEGTDGLSSPLSASRRQWEALRRVAAHLDAAREAMDADGPLEAAAEDLRAALNTLGEVGGETATEEILDAVFSRFCIGK